MAAAAKKKGNKKGKTLTLTDFLAEDSGSGGNAPPPQPSYAKSTSWADETDDLEGDVSTSWHTGEDSYRAPAIDRNILPTAPRSAREPNVDRSRLPRSPPYTAFLGNLPYDVSEESIKDFFRGLAISAVRLPREPSNPERLKGFGYAEFDDVDSLLRALTLNEENLGNRRIRVDIADQSNDKEGRDNGQMGGRDRMGRMGDMAGPDKTDSDDWRARPTANTDDGPPKREESAFGSRDRYGDRDGLRRDNDRGFGDRDRGFGGRDRYDDRGGENGAFGSRRDRDDGGRRAFGSGYRRDDDDQSGGGGGSRYGARDRYGGDREGRYERQDEGREERGEGGPTERPKLILKPRSMAKEEQQAGSGGAPPAAPAAARISGRASIFGAAKPVDTAAKEREVEEKLQRQLEEDQSKGFDRKPRDRDRDPSWRNEEPPSERSRTGSESSHPGSTSGGRASRRRESERSVENEVFSGKEDDPPSPVARPSSANSSTFSSKEPLKVMPAPPPKDNAWAKRPALSTGSGKGCAPISTSDTAPPKLRRE
ncbi:eukaryotic translation initiation factor 4B isoform X8 [Oncorhynchus tshawytscha]|uniref:eukaryotic translation initiation factor 4B isoform X8 n=1 Tax=Oncorhynchus tshawytscha TaxID=74940 RepID=UPI000D0A1F3A|nr:eukaryotic translation initiation factor 4B isoform X8 [Oncorhynchus tshawytscha]